MRVFKNFTDFNSYFGTEAPRNEHIDVGNYGNQYLMQSEEVSLDFHRISIKQRLHFPKDHPLKKLNKKNVSALFYSSPKDSISWHIEKRFEGYYIQFSKEIINNNKHIFKKLMDFGQHEPLFLEQEEEEEIEHIFKKMLIHYKTNPESNEILLAYSLVLFNWVEKLYDKHFNQKTSNYNFITVKFQQSLNNYYQNKQTNLKLIEIPSVNHFANELKLSANYLGDIIKKHTGQSALNHIHDYIIKEAKFKLIKTNATVKNIAWDLGFEYSNYFTRFFKSKTGLTPKQFRNK
ncbi:AraC family transcriptional regulator [Flavobacterium sp. J27]|uniref:helix-turn-helix domain-containing protein n=1 Tax=Flavobacterium sp. J27 TaxID=2060419 RepID=UPI00103069F6|nr:helix-turn-helix domain-containing protein [Flavobacterium sp. J27]